MEEILHQMMVGDSHRMEMVRHGVEDLEEPEDLGEQDDLVDQEDQDGLGTLETLGDHQDLDLGSNHCLGKVGQLMTITRI